MQGWPGYRVFMLKDKEFSANADPISVTHYILLPPWNKNQFSEFKVYKFNYIIISIIILLEILKAQAQMCIVIFISQKK